MRYRRIIDVLKTIDIREATQEEYDVLHTAVDAMKILWQIAVAVEDTNEDSDTDIELTYSLIKDVVGRWEIRNGIERG